MDYHIQKTKIKKADYHYFKGGKNMPINITLEDSITRLIEQMEKNMELCFKNSNCEFVSDFCYKNLIFNWYPNCFKINSIEVYDTDICDAIENFADKLNKYLSLQEAKADREKLIALINENLEDE